MDKQQILEHLDDIWTFGHETNDEEREAVRLAMDIVESHKVGEWIPCSERMPEEYGDYLVTFGFNDVGVRMVDSGSFSENGFEFTNVIAWQPLPEAYHESVD